MHLVGVFGNFQPYRKQIASLNAPLWREKLWSSSGRTDSHEEAPFSIASSSYWKTKVSRSVGEVPVTFWCEWSRQGRSPGALEQTGDIARRPGNGRPSKQGNETTVKKLRKQLTGQGKTPSESSVLRRRQPQGWTVRGSAYCQMIQGCI